MVPKLCVECCTPVVVGTTARTCNCDQVHCDECWSMIFDLTPRYTQIDTTKLFYVPTSVYILNRRDLLPVTEPLYTMTTPKQPHCKKCGVEYDFYALKRANLD